MTRVLLGLALGALIFTAAIGAKVINVTNPMSSDLDANEHAITNATEVDANTLVANDRLYTNGAELLAGSADPAAGLDATVGSLYLRRHPDAQSVAHGELWFKIGVYDTDWTCVVGCSP